MDKKVIKQPESANKSNTEANSTLNNDDRRKAVRNILAGSGVVAAATAGKWSQPVIDAVILPAHAQTSVLAFSMSGNIEGSPVASVSLPKQQSILDYFVGSAHAQEASSDTNLGGACTNFTVTGESFTLDLEFVDDPSISISGSLSNNALSATGSGVTLSADLAESNGVFTANGTIANGSGTFAFTADSNTQACTPVAPVTTPAPTTTSEPTTTPEATTTPET